MYGPLPPLTKIRIGVSACLLGQQVRYDGGHKHDAFVADVLGREVELVPVCPEVEMGLGTPREPMRLERHGGSLRMITVNSRIDQTPRLERWASKRLDGLADEKLSGYIFKADSPSCGVDRVKVFDGAEDPQPAGRGRFAAALIERFPELPVEDERRLGDPGVREAFMRRVLEYSQRSLALARAVSVVRVTPAGVTQEADCAAVEEPLEVRLNDRPFAVIMRTPGSDRELTAGFLFSEGIISSVEELGAVEHCRHPDHPDVHNVVNVFLLGDARARLADTLEHRRNVLATSSCGICGRLTIDSLRTRAQAIRERSSVARSVVHRFPEALRARQSLFDKTGGLHAAGLFGVDGTLITSAEDVGRHNAVDKVIGRTLLDAGLPRGGHVLVVSGRASFEIVQKAWIAGIEIVCAVSAPSSLAVQLAEEAGITLVGFLRDRTFNVYAHADRLRNGLDAVPPAS